PRRHRAPDTAAAPARAGPPPLAGDPPHGAGAARLVQIHHRDGRAVGSQPGRDCGADAARRAGDERHLPVESWHLARPFHRKLERDSSYYRQVSGPTQRVSTNRIVRSITAIIDGDDLQQQPPATPVSKHSTQQAQCSSTTGSSNNSFRQRTAVIKHNSHQAQRGDSIAGPPDSGLKDRPTGDPRSGAGVREPSSRTRRSTGTTINGHNEGSIA